MFFVACPPCQDFAPHMATLHESLLAQGVAVEFISLSTSGADNDERIEGFKTEFNHGWPFVGPEGGSLGRNRSLYQWYFWTIFWNTCHCCYSS